MNLNTTAFTHEQAQAIALEAHTGQFRRDGVTPYANHLQAVVGKLEGNDAKCVAWLHDVLKDTALTEQDLRNKEVPEHIIAAIKLLTKKSDQSYEDYLKGLTESTLATIVKMPDMMHNLSDSPTDKQKEKYEKGLKFFWDFLASSI